MSVVRDGCLLSAAGSDSVPGVSVLHRLVLRKKTSEVGTASGSVQPQSSWSSPICPTFLLSQLSFFFFYLTFLTS